MDRNSDSIEFQSMQSVAILVPQVCISIKVDDMGSDSVGFSPLSLLFVGFVTVHGLGPRFLEIDLDAGGRFETRHSLSCLTKLFIR
jgi:hypothetical protein